MIEVLRAWTREADLVEGAVLVVLGEGVLLQEVVLQEARCLQHDLVALRQGVLHHASNLLTKADGKTDPSELTLDMCSGLEV